MEFVESYLLRLDNALTAHVIRSSYMVPTNLKALKSYIENSQSSLASPLDIVKDPSLLSRLSRQMNIVYLEPIQSYCL